MRVENFVNRAHFSVQCYLHCSDFLPHPKKEKDGLISYELRLFDFIIIINNNIWSSLKR